MRSASGLPVGTRRATVRLSTPQLAGVGHVELGTEAAVGVHVGAEEGHRPPACSPAPRRWRGATPGCRSGLSAAEDVAPGGLVEQRDVHVQPVAGLARVGLGHEGGIHLVVVGDVLDQALEQHRVVAGFDRVRHVVQVDLELRRGAFLDDGVGRDALFLGALEDVLQAVDILVEVVDQVDLGRLRRLPEIGERGGCGRPFTFS